MIPVIMPAKHFLNNGLFRRMIRVIVGLLMVTGTIVFSGCASLGVYTKNTSGQYINRHDGFACPVPKSWMQRNGLDGVVLTKDGEKLELLNVLWAPMNKPIAPLEKSFQEHMLVPEMAEVMLASLKAAEGIVRADVLENAVITVDGQKAFRIHMEFESEGGFIMRQIVTGVPHPNKKGVVLLNFYAAKQHYFPKYKPEYDRMVEGFRFLRVNAVPTEGSSGPSG